MLVHLPIGILLIALLLQWLSQRSQYALGEGALRLLWVSGTLASWLSCATGYLLSLSGEYDEQTVDWHMWMAVSLALLASLLCVLIFKHVTGKWFRAASLLLLLLIMITGHLGGSLTHGADYLTSGLSNSDGQPKTVAKVIPNIQEASAYTDVVEPLLQSKCYSCHGPTKQKGGLRMDSPAWLLKGGKEGQVIRGGQADQSELIKRLLLAREEEHHMPPKEKPQLSERQIALLHWWVEQGADFTKKIKELPQAEKTKALLLSFQGPAQQKMPSTVPEEPVDAADEKALQRLRDRGIIVLPVAQNSHYLMVNLTMAAAIKDADIELLLPLKKQLVWLKAGGTNISDTALQFISQCSQLTVLQLNSTRITDRGLPLLRSLSNLQSLNLVGSSVSMQGVMPLQSLKKLQAIYLYQTQVQSADWKQLTRAFPRVQLDSGGYKVPYFTTDTTLMQPPVQGK